MAGTTRPNACEKRLSRGLRISAETRRMTATCTVARPARHSPTTDGNVGLENHLLPTGLARLQPNKPDKPAFAGRPIRRHIEGHLPLSISLSPLGRDIDICRAGGLQPSRIPIRARELSSPTCVGLGRAPAQQNVGLGAKITPIRHRCGRYISVVRSAKSSPNHTAKCRQLR